MDVNSLPFSFFLKEYFSQHLGEYKNVLAALEDLNMSILKAMDKTKKVRDLQIQEIRQPQSDGLHFFSHEVGNYFCLPK